MIYDAVVNSEVLRKIPESTESILDIGCGTGNLARAINGKIEVDGITSNSTEGSAAERFCRRVFVYDLELGLPQQIGRDYDLIVMSHILEHLANADAMLRDARSILKLTSGKILVAIPNLLFFQSRMSILAGNFNYTESGLMDSTHIRWYTHASMSRLLVESGFRIIESYGDGWIPQPVLRSVLPDVSRRIDRMFARRLPGIFGQQLIFIAEPD